MDDYAAAEATRLGKSNSGKLRVIGNMNKASLEAAARAAKKGVVVVRRSRVATRAVGRNVEVNDDELGFVASDELNPQKSRFLLTLALLKPRPNSQLQELFSTY
jgi:L-asparaginase